MRLHLLDDPVAVLLLPRPDPLDERLAAELVAGRCPPSRSSRSTTTWVAMPAWSVPGIQSASYPCIRAAGGSCPGAFAERVADVQAPVTFGGGITMQYGGLSVGACAWKYPRSIHVFAQRGSTSVGS